MNADDFRMMPVLPDLTKLSDGTRGVRGGGFGYRLEYEYAPAVRPVETSPVGQHFMTRVMRDIVQIGTFFDEMIRLTDSFGAITTSQVNDSDPHWDNAWLPAMDGMSIYTLIAARKPKDVS